MYTSLYCTRQHISTPRATKHCEDICCCSFDSTEEDIQIAVHVFYVIAESYRAGHLSTLSQAYEAAGKSFDIRQSSLNTPQSLPQQGQVNLDLTKPLTGKPQIYYITAICRLVLDQLCCPGHTQLMTFSPSLLLQQEDIPCQPRQMPDECPEVPRDRAASGRS